MLVGLSLQCPVTSEDLLGFCRNRRSQVNFLEEKKKKKKSKNETKSHISLLRLKHLRIYRILWGNEAMKELSPSLPQSRASM